MGTGKQQQQKRNHAVVVRLTNLCESCEVAVRTVKGAAESIAQLLVISEPYAYSPVKHRDLLYEGWDEDVSILRGKGVHVEVRPTFDPNELHRSVDYIIDLPAYAFVPGHILTQEVLRATRTEDVRCLRATYRMDCNNASAILMLAILCFIDFCRSSWALGRLHGGADVRIYPILHGPLRNQVIKPRRCRLTIFNLRCFNYNVQPARSLGAGVVYNLLPRGDSGMKWTILRHGGLGLGAWLFTLACTYLIGLPYWELAMYGHMSVDAPRVLIKAVLCAFAILLVTSHYIINPRSKLQRDAFRVAMLLLPVWVIVVPVYLAVAMFLYRPSAPLPDTLMTDKQMAELKRRMEGARTGSTVRNNGDSERLK